MKELADQVFQTWGWKAVVAIMCAGFAIWVLAHWNSAPGTRVSVLWGLVEYTKRSHQAEGWQESIPTPTISLLKESVQTPKVSSHKESDQITSLEGKRQGRVEVIGHAYSKASWSAGSAELRKLRGLRELSALESGKPLNSMPMGTFGFMSQQTLTMTIPSLSMINGPDLASVLLMVRVQRFNSTSVMGPSFEIHCNRQADRFLLGFTTETTASALISNSGIKEVVLAAQPEADLTSLILIEVGLLRSWSFRLMEGDPDEGSFVMDIALW